MKIRDLEAPYPHLFRVLADKVAAGRLNSAHIEALIANPDIALSGQPTLKLLERCRGFGSLVAQAQVHKFLAVVTGDRSHADAIAGSLKTSKASKSAAWQVTCELVYALLYLELFEEARAVTYFDVRQDDVTKILYTIWSATEAEEDYDKFFRAMRASSESAQAKYAYEIARKTGDPRQINAVRNDYNDARRGNDAPDLSVKTKRLAEIEMLAGNIRRAEMLTDDIESLSWRISMRCLLLKHTGSESQMQAIKKDLADKRRLKDNNVLHLAKALADFDMDEARDFAEYRDEAPFRALIYSAIAQHEDSKEEDLNDAEAAMAETPLHGLGVMASYEYIRALMAWDEQEEAKKVALRHRRMQNRAIGLFIILKADLDLPEWCALAGI